MSTMMLTTIGLYNMNPNLFRDMVVPEILKKEVLKNRLLMDTAEFEVLYSNPDLMQFLLKSWSESRIDVWDKLAETLLFEYNPIENYDRKETHEHTIDKDDTSSKLSRNSERDLTDRETREHNTKTDKKQEFTAGTTETIGESGTIGTDTSNTFTAGVSVTEALSGNLTRSGTNQTQDSKTAYNTNTLQLTDQRTETPNLTDVTSNTTTTTPTGSENTDIDSTETRNLTTQTTRGGKDTTTNDDSEVEKITGTINRGGTEKEQENNDTEHRYHDTENIRAHGNIGVMSTQDMINQEREVVMFNLYEVIINEYIERFCIQVY